jgi:hypothetical protein
MVEHMAQKDLEALGAEALGAEALGAEIDAKPRQPHSAANINSRVKTHYLHGPTLGLSGCRGSQK